MKDQKTNSLLHILPVLTHTQTLPQKHTRWLPLSQHLHDFSWRQVNRWLGQTKNRCPHITTKKKNCAFLLNTPPHRYIPDPSSKIHALVQTIAHKKQVLTLRFEPKNKKQRLDCRKTLATTRNNISHPTMRTCPHPPLSSPHVDTSNTTNNPLLPSHLAFQRTQP
jgi:hypothetical protein